MQIVIADVDANGRALGTNTTFALCGQVRSQGESDDSVNRLATRAGCELLPCLYLRWYLCIRSVEECLVVPKIITIRTYPIKPRVVRELSRVSTASQLSFWFSILGDTKSKRLRVQPRKRWDKIEQFNSESISLK